MATSVASFLDRRIDPGTLPMAIGDFLVIAFLLSVGVVQHNGVSYLTNQPVGWLLTLVPFLVGWAVAAPLLGAYSPGASETAKAAVPLAIRSWFVADLIGMAIRATPFFEGGVAITFVIVTLVIGIVGLSIWRTLFFKLT